MPKLPFFAVALLSHPATLLAQAPAAVPQGGTIAVLVRSPGGGVIAEGDPFVHAVGDALSDKGFTVLPDPDHAAYSAEITLSRAEVGTGKAKVRSEGASVLPGMGAGVGTGIVVPLPSGKSSLVALQRSQIELRIRRRWTDAVLWQGSATTVRAAGTKKGADDAVATDLSRGLLAAYPAQPEGLVGVP